MRSIDWRLLSVGRRRRPMLDVPAQAARTWTPEEIAEMAEGNGLAEGGDAAALKESFKQTETIEPAHPQPATAWSPQQMQAGLLLLEQRIVQLERMDLQARATAQAQLSFNQRAAALDLAIKAAGPGATSDQFDTMAAGFLTWLRGQ